MGTINRENAGPGTELNRRPQPFQGCVLPAYPFVLQLNFAERPQFCDHSVTSADVRLASAPNLTRAACLTFQSFVLAFLWRAHAQSGFAEGTTIADRS